MRRGPTPLRQPRAYFGLVLILLLVAPMLRAADAPAADTNWPMWRGPRGDGHSAEANVPTRWSATENVAWKVPIPGWGHSSPVVWGERVFVTSYVESGTRRVLLCLDRNDGKILWERTVLASPPEQKHRLNSFASATPATDGKRVWVTFFERPRIQVVCYDVDGNELWRKSPGTFASVHGFCSSPVIHNDLLIVNCDQDAPAYIVAFDRQTGDERWRIDRPNKTRSYCTPLIAELAGRTQMVLSGSKSVASYDPDTGKQFWVMDGPTEQMVASLVHTQGVLFVTGGFPERHVLGVDPSGAGDVTKTHILWRDKKGVSYVPSPIAHDQWFYVVSDGGVCVCYEAKTGKVAFSQRLGKHHSASAVAAGGNLYFTSDAGETFVLKGGPAYELVSKNDLGEECYASPAISRGQVFIRTLKNLYCIK